MLKGLNLVTMLIVCLSGEALSELNIVTRTEWNAKAAKESLKPLELPVERVIIAHTAGNECKTKPNCLQEVLNIQNFHMNKLGFDDISYNFLIGSDGNVYEGRGSDFQGAIAKGFNAGSINIGYIGNFQTSLPSQSALDAGKLLMEKLRSELKLKEDYKLFAHRQVSPTMSPGDELYAEIKKWPRWTSEI